MPSQGPLNGSIFADDSTIGTTAWTNPGNTVTSNNVYATNNLLGGTTTHYVKATGFSFAIPAGSTINGIQVDVERSYTLLQIGADPRDHHVRLVQGGSILGNALSGGTITSSDVYRTFGSASELWGLSWTTTDINASTFGCVYSADEVSGGFTYRCRVDHIRITVTYTLATNKLYPYWFFKQ